MVPIFYNLLLDLSPLLRILRITISMSTASTQKTSLLFWLDIESLRAYTQAWRGWVKRWPLLDSHPLVCMCDGSQMDDDNWRLATDDLFGRDTKIILWEPEGKHCDEGTRNKAMLAAAGYVVSTTYSCFLDPKLTLTKKLIWPEADWFDEDDPPAIICNRSELGPSEIDCEKLEAWGSEAPGFSEMPSVDCDLIRAWDVALVSQKFARVVALISKNVIPVDRMDYFYYYCALKRGERITRVNGEDMGIE